MVSTADGGLELGEHAPDDAYYRDTNPSLIVHSTRRHDLDGRQGGQSLNHLDQSRLALVVPVGDLAGDGEDDAPDAFEVGFGGALDGA